MSKPNNDPLDFLGGARFKRYEEAAQSYLDGPFAAIRVDGRGFSKFTRAQGYDAPYDLGFMETMDSVARSLLLLVDGAHFAYSQSDEISVVFSPSGPADNKQWWFGGKVQKVASIAAAKASVSFLRNDHKVSDDSLDPIFDGRVLSLTSDKDAEEYLRWRRFDAQKNSISMAASSLFSHKELNGVTTRERAEMLKGTALERLPEGFFNGRLHYRTKVRELTWDGYAKQKIEVERTAVATSPATRDFVERALPSLIAHRHFTESTTI